MAGDLDLSSLCEDFAPIASEAPALGVFPSFLTVGVLEQGDRDPNERPDNEIHP
jgi:hypothetical protein